MGSIIADQDTSFQALDQILLRMIDIVRADHGVNDALGFTGGANTARMFVSLKPLNERKATATEIIARLRPQLAKSPGASLYLQASQDVRIGGRSSSAEYQFTMQGDNLADLVTYSPKMLQKLKSIHILADVNSDLQNQGLKAMVFLRPADCRALQHRAATNRRHALRRLRPAAGIHHVHVFEPIPRSNRRQRRVLAESAVPAGMST